MVSSLSNQQLIARMIEKDRLSHAYIFSGSVGTGKKETAMWLACALFCQHKEQGEPCMNCDHCRRILNQEFPDVWYLSPTGKTIKTEQVSQLKRELSMSGLESRRQCFIIEHAETMTEAAANQLLKFIEEPDTPMVAILLTENIGQLLPTIISRCQVLQFTRPPQTAYEQQLKEAGISESLAHRLSYLTSNQEEAIALSKDEVFLKQEKVARQWYHQLVQKDLMSFVAVQTFISDIEVTTGVHQLQFLDLVTLCAKDHYLETQSTHDLKLLSGLEQARIKWKHHVNFQNILEQLAYYMLKGGR